jgi:hypothetical protein
MIRRGVHKSVQSLEKQIRDWKEDHETVRVEEDHRRDPRLL